MGGSKPSAPTVIMPAQTQPQQFQTIIPEKSFKDLAEQMNRIETETGKIQDQRYDEVGTPKPTITKDPSFAKQDPADYLPKRYNPDTGKMEVV